MGASVAGLDGVRGRPGQPVPGGPRVGWRRVAVAPNEALQPKAAAMLASWGSLSRRAAAAAELGRSFPQRHAMIRELDVGQSALLTDVAMCINYYRLFSPGLYCCIHAPLQIDE